jgi:hypothetical protein
MPANTRLHQLAEHGQSVWIDFLSRDLLESGALARAVKRDAVVGVSSNPTIFAKALSDGDAYDEQIAATEGDAISVFLALAMRDVTTACDLLRPIWERTVGGDGYVSIEVDPNLADDTAGTIASPRAAIQAASTPSPASSSPASTARPTAASPKPIVTTSRGGSASPTPSSPTSSTRRCSSASGGTISPRAARRGSAASGRRRR